MMPEINRDVIRQLEQITKGQVKYLEFTFLTLLKKKICLIKAQVA